MDDRTSLLTAAPLATGYQITWYTIREVLGKGGFGITYLAYDNNLDREVAIKEYLPTSFAHRHGDQSVKPITSDDGDNFSWGLANFLKEAKTLARFNHENIVRVHTVFEANSTAYMVMEYEQGDNLASIISDWGSISQDFQKKIFYPIIEGLNKIHELGFIHRDIKPSNIYIRSNGTPVLIDFGSARQTALQQTSEFTALISQGYTPLEQYSADYGDQGPWTDIYALAATMYHGITGSRPADSLGRSAFQMRSQPDQVKPLSAQDHPGYEQSFLDATYSGLSLQPDLRPRSLTAWLTLFQSQTTPSPFTGSASNSMPPQDDRTRIAPVRSNPNLQNTNLSQPHSQPNNNHNDLGIEGDTFATRPAPATRDPVIQPDRSTEKEIFGDDDFEIPPATRKVTNTVVKKQNNKGLPLMTACVVIVACGAGLAYFLLQKNQATPVISESSSTVISEPNPVSVNQAPVTKMETTQPSAPATVVNREESGLFFDQPLTTDIVYPPRSIEELSKSSPIVSPVEGLDEAAWKEQTCSNCHSWTRENLCAQGNFYVSNDDAAKSRIHHPFSGLFKTALRDWASQGCR